MEVHFGHENWNMVRPLICHLLSQPCCVMHRKKSANSFVTWRFRGFVWFRNLPGIEHDDWNQNGCGPIRAPRRHET